MYEMDSIKDNTKSLKEALDTIERLSPNLYSIMREGFYVINCKRGETFKQIESAVNMYLYAKRIKLTPRAIQLLIRFVKYDTSTKSRKKIKREIMMTTGTLNQNASNLRKAGILIYPYTDSKKSEVDPALIKLKNYIIDQGKSNILIKYYD